MPEAALDGGADAAKPDASGVDAGPGSKQIELKFAARLTDKGELACGQKYADQGTAGSEVTPKDFRFYSCEQRQCLNLGCESDKDCRLNLENPGTGTSTGTTTSS